MSPCETLNRGMRLVIYVDTHVLMAVEVQSDLLLSLIFLVEVAFSATVS